jgi:hypothetical protein
LERETEDVGELDGEEEGVGVTEQVEEGVGVTERVGEGVLDIDGSAMKRREGFELCNIAYYLHTFITH